MSLDYIKSESHRDHFLSGAPECIVVDEAHTCTMTGSGRQLRFALLKTHRRCRPASYHCSQRLLIRETTTRSAICFSAESCFLGVVVCRRFAIRHDRLRFPSCRSRTPLRTTPKNRYRRMAGQFNISTRKVKDASYALTGEWGSFFDEVREYCYGIAQRAENEKERRLA